MHHLELRCKTGGSSARDQLVQNVEVTLALQDHSLQDAVHSDNNNEESERLKRVTLAGGVAGDGWIVNKSSKTGRKQRP